MTDAENYVVCGQDVAELKPTAEMRFAVPPHTSPRSPRLQQKWVASAKMQDGGMWEEHRWKDVPHVIVNDLKD